MHYTCKYNSPIGIIKLISDGEFLTNLYIQNQLETPYICIDNNDLEIFKKTKKWLDQYFNGEIPNINLDIKLIGTDFQKEVWEILYNIPYGTVITYKNIAVKIASQRKIPKMSSQAIGRAVSKNPISIIVPCHRVIGSNGSLVGYNGGIEIKEKLLQIENVELNNLNNFFRENILKN